MKLEEPNLKKKSGKITVYTAGAMECQTLCLEQAYIMVGLICPLPLLIRIEKV